MTITSDVNTEIDDLEETVVKLIKAGIPVFFASDVEKHLSSTLGIVDLKLFDYEVLWALCLIELCGLRISW